MRQCSSSYRMSGLDRRTNVDVQILSAASKAIAEKCFWNACKALSFGLFLMAVGAIMAIIGYYAEQLSSDDIVSKTDTGNSSTTSIRTTKTTKKSSHIYKLSYAGPIVMGVGGFIVVAACVMTFEARDRAAKFMSNQLKIMGGGAGVGGTGVGAGGTMSGHRGHGRQTPSGGYLSRGDSGRSSYQNPCDAGWHKMNKSPSAPNLAGVNRGPGSAVGAGRLPFRHKHAVHHVLSPGGGGGRTLLSPHTLRRQAMSMDTQDYNPFFSPPRSRHSSSGLLSCNNGNSNNNGGGGGNNNNSNSNNNNNIDKQGSCSRESVNDPRARGSHGSMVLDLHVPNECPITMRVRDRSRRSDTARRHVLRRQTPVELDDAIIAYAATAAADHRQRAKRCTRSATCDVPHVVKSKRRRQDSSCSDVVTRRRSGSPVCAGGYAAGDGAGGWRSSANDVVDSAERARTAGRSGSRGSAVSSSSSPQRAAAGRQGHRATVPGRSSPVPPDGAASVAADSKMSLSRTCSDIVSIDKSFEEESNYSSS